MRKIKETASAGSTGAGAIANVPSNRMGGMQTRMSLQQFMNDFYGRINNRNKFSAVPGTLKGSIKKISESASHPYQGDDATSRFKSIQTSGEYEKADVITFGIEDDAGALMKVTIPIQQSEEFERHVAQTLADVLEFKKTGRGEDKTLAELLYELKDQFTIVNAEFPTIPKDAVYNADEITEDMPDDNAELDNDELGDEEMDDMDDESSDGEGDGLDDEETSMDDEDMADDFDEEEEGTSKEELLTSVLGMLKSQAEKDIAQANAEAEKAKERQAELALKASKNELETQEEMISAKAEMEAEKEKEKRAKEMAELAKHNYKKKKGMKEGFSPLFRSSLLEFDSNDTPQSLRKQMATISMKFKPEPEDSTETRRYKQEQKGLAMRDLRIEMRAAKNRQEYEKNNSQQDQDQNDQEQQGQNDQQGQNQQRGPM